MIAFTYFRETNKIRLSGQITQGTHIPTRMVYPFLTPLRASEGACSNMFIVHWVNETLLLFLQLNTATSVG